MKKFIWVVVFLCATLSFSQQKYSVLMGTVTANGNALPGVTVQLSGPNLMGQRSVVTNDKGLYRFNLIPAGKGYELNAKMMGFQAFIRRNIDLPLGTTITIDLQLNEATVEEEIIVTAEAPLIDVTSSSVATNVDEAFFQTLTNDRQYQTIMSMMPGAIEGNNPYMLGGSDSDNIYMVDGADTTDPLTKTWGAALNFDTIEEVQVVTGGVSAEYGRGQGAVVNLVTKSGGNEFHGSVRFVKSKIDWNQQDQDKNFNDDPAASTKYTEEDRWALTLGGPIIKDKLWFFAAYETRDKMRANSYYATKEAWNEHDPANMTQVTPSYKGHYFSFKLTYQLNENHSFQAFYSEDPITFPNAAYRGYTNYENPFAVNQEQGGDLMYLEWNWSMTNDSFLSVKYQQNDSPLNQVPVNDQWTSYENPYMLWYWSGAGYYYMDSFGVADTRYISERKYDSLRVSWDKFLDTSMGSHDIKVGMETRDSEYGSRSYAWNGGHRLIWWPQWDDVNYYVYEDNRSMATTYEDYMAFYIQDKWAITDRLTLNLGLRTEKLELSNLNKEEVVSNDFGDTLAWRLGFAYDIGGDSFHGSMNRYYEATGNWVVTNSQPDQLYYRDNYYLDGVSAFGEPWANHADWMAMNPADHPELWSYVGRNTYGSDGVAEILGSIEPGYMDEYNLGYEKQLTPIYAVGVNLWYRVWKDTYEDADFNADGIWEFQTVDGKWREYTALMFTMQKKLADDGLQFLASYTYSKTEGISTGDYSTVYLDSVYDVHNWYGRLGIDHPHQFKFNGSYTFDMGLIVGLSYQYRSGAAWTAVAQVADMIPNSASNYQYPYAEKRGSRRLPSFNRFDLHLEYKFDFDFWNGMSVSAYADVFNLLNSRRPLSVYNTIGFGEYNTEAAPGTAAYTEYVTTHAPTVTEEYDTFGEYSSWSMPRSYYVGVTVQF